MLSFNEVSATHMEDVAKDPVLLILRACLVRSAGAILGKCQSSKAGAGDEVVDGQCRLFIDDGGVKRSLNIDICFTEMGTGVEEECDVSW